MKTKYFLQAIISIGILGTVLACNNSSEVDKINEDSLNKSTLDNRDVNNRNTLIYDSTKQVPSDTVKMPQ